MKAEAYSLYKHKQDVAPDLPDFTAESVLDIDFARLRKIGVQHILIDLDQTLKRVGAWHLEAAVIAIFTKLNASKHFTSINLVTNNSRAKRYASAIGARAFMPYFEAGRFIRKPNQKFFQRVLKELHTSPSHVVMIGDKVHFDIRGGNKAGMFTVLVNPLGRDFVYDKLLFTRFREKRVLAAARRTLNKPKGPL